eukprot:Em0030g44a
MDSRAPHEESTDCITAVFSTCPLKVYGFCKLAHLARATPPSLSVKALELFDLDVRDCLSQSTSVDMTDVSWNQAQLSLSREGLGLHFEPNQYNVALKWWLGLDTSCGSSCSLCPDSILDPLGHHASTCKRGGDAVHRHNLLRDVFADSCRLAHLGVKVEVGNNITQDHDHTRPADVLVHNWSLGKPAAFDFCVTSPLNSLIVSEAGVSSGAAAHASEIRKHNSNDAKCGELGWVCIPLVVETYSAWGQEAVKSFAQLASRLAIVCSKPKSVVINDLYGRLNTCIIRSISSAILSRMVST